MSPGFRPARSSFTESSLGSPPTVAPVDFPTWTCLATARADECRRWRTSKVDSLHGSSRHGAPPGGPLRPDGAPQRNHGDTAAPVLQSLIARDVFHDAPTSGPSDRSTTTEPTAPRAASAWTGRVQLRCRASDTHPGGILRRESVVDGASQGERHGRLLALRVRRVLRCRVRRWRHALETANGRLAARPHSAQFRSLGLSARAGP